MLSSLKHKGMFKNLLILEALFLTSSNHGENLNLNKKTTKQNICKLINVCYKQSLRLAQAYMMSSYVYEISLLVLFM